MAAPAKTHEVFRFLKMCADQMRTVTYKEVADATQLAPVGLGQQLRYIRDEVCRKRGLPWLTAIVVSSDNHMPGGGFLPDDVSFGDAGNRLWRGMVLHVFAFDWDSVRFEEVD